MTMQQRERWRRRVRILGTVVAVGVAAAQAGPAHAWPGKWTDCVSCHTADNGLEDAQVFVAVEGTDVTASGTYDTTPGATVEVDFVYTNMADAGWVGVAPQIVLPTGWTPPAAGTTGFAPDFSGSGGPAWNTAWDNANGAGTAPGWCGDRNCTGAAYGCTAGGMTGDGWTHDYGGTAWETSKAAAEDMGTPGLDLDGVADRMGADARITVPGATGNYTVWVAGIGHATSNGVKAYVARAVTLRVCAAPPCGALPNTPPTTTLDPLPAGLTGSSLSLTGTASDADGTVAGVDLRIQRTDLGQYWDGAAWVAGAVDLPATDAGGGFATWQYAWSGISGLDAVPVTITAAARDDVGDPDGSPATDSLLVDQVAPRVANGVRLSALPAAGQSLTLQSDWTEGAPGTPRFQYAVNGAWSAWSPSDGGVGNTASRTESPALDGNDQVDGLRSDHTDAWGNGPTLSEDLAVVPVRPLTPPAPTVGGATTSTLDVTVVEAETLAPSLTYAIQESTGGLWVQSDGTLGVGEYWGHGTGTVTVTGLAQSTAYTFRVAAANPTEASPTLAGNATSALGPTRSGTTATPGNELPTCTLDPVASPVTGPSLTLTGTASDPDGSVTQVLVTLQRVSDGLHWNGSGWQSGPVEVPAVDGGGGFATWSYLFTGYTLDGDAVSITARSHDGIGYSPATSAQIPTVDHLAPRVATGVRFQSAPVSGAGFTLRSDWTEGAPGTPEFDYQLNGAWSGWAPAVSGGNTAQRAYALTLDGNDAFQGLRSRHTDAAGNGPTQSEDLAVVYVTPQTPPAPAVGSPSATSLTVTVNEAESLAPALAYAVQEDGGLWVQGDGTLAAAPYWGHPAGPVVVHGLASSSSYGFRVAAGNPSDPAPTLAAASTSAFSASASGTTSAPGDTDAPCAIADLAVTGRTADAVTLGFTAPVEECAGGFGDPTAYMVRYAFAPIDDVAWPTARIFDDAVPAVAPAGSPEALVVTGLDSNQRYHFQVKAVDEYGLTGPLASPAAPGTDAGRTYLHLGWNMGGMEGVPGAADTCQLVFGMGSCYGWQSTGLGDWDGGYVNIGPDGVVSPGTGYWLSIASSTSELTPPGDATPTAGDVAVPLSPGMNLASNPHDQPVRVADLVLERTSGSPQSWVWADAVAQGLVLPALYAYDGVNYAGETATGLPEGLVHPRKGYWVKLDVDDGQTYRLLIPDPTP